MRKKPSKTRKKKYQYCPQISSPQQSNTFFTTSFFFYIYALFYFQTAFLEVVIPPDIIYEETSGDMMVPEGGSAKLICKARGYPKPRVVWRREDGAQVVVRTSQNLKTERLTSVEGEVLFLTRVTRSEMGAYLCIAANGVPPSVSKRMMLHVHCKSYFY